MDFAGKSNKFPGKSIFGRVRELLINSEKARISSIFKKDAERFLCLQFSIIHAHYPLAKMTMKISWKSYENVAY